MGRRYPKRTQLKYTKQRYRVRNWREYEAGLRKRGDLTLWFSEKAIAPEMRRKCLCYSLKLTTRWPPRWLTVRTTNHLSMPQLRRMGRAHLRRP